MPEGQIYLEFYGVSPQQQLKYSQVHLQSDQTARYYGPVFIPRWICVDRLSSQGGDGFPQVTSGRTVPKGPVTKFFHTIVSWY